jgi:hypothetical protein
MDGDGEGLTIQGGRCDAMRVGDALSAAMPWVMLAV